MQQSQPLCQLATRNSDTGFCTLRAGVLSMVAVIVCCNVSNYQSQSIHTCIIIIPLCGSLSLYAAIFSPCSSLITIITWSNIFTILGTNHYMMQYFHHFVQDSLSTAVFSPYCSPLTVLHTFHHTFHQSLYVAIFTPNCSPITMFCNVFIFWSPIPCKIAFFHHYKSHLWSVRYLLK